MSRDSWALISGMRGLVIGTYYYEAPALGFALGLIGFEIILSLIEEEKTNEHTS